MVIYKIIINGKIYIGQSINFLNRKKEHISLLVKNKHYNTYLQNYFNKYGRLENFTIEELEKCENIDQLNEREKYWIKFYNSLSPNGFNFRDGGENSKLSDETKNILSLIGKTKIGVKNNNYNKFWTDEQKNKASKRMIGRYFGDKNPNSKNYYVLNVYDWEIEKIALLKNVKNKIKTFDTRRFNKSVTGKKFIVFTEKFFLKNKNDIDFIAMSIIDNSMFKNKIYNESKFYKESN